MSGKGDRALHADDSHSEAKAGDQPYQELKPESETRFETQHSVCRVQGAGCRVADPEGSGSGQRFGAEMGVECRIYG